MKQKIIIYSIQASIVLLCLTSAIASASTSGLQITISSNPTIAAPGTNGYLEVTLQAGSTNVNDIELTVTSWDPKVVQEKGNWDVDVGDLESGDSTNVLYEFLVSDDASPGLYQIIILVECSSGLEIRQTAIIQVEDLASVDIASMQPSSVNIGQQTTLTFNVTNSGGKDVTNVLFTWEEKNNLILPLGSDNRISISSIPGNKYVLVPVEILADPSMTPGIYPLDITLTFYDSTGTQQTVESIVGLQISGGTDFEIIQQQSSSGVSLSITNVGANTASSIIVTIPQQPGYTVSGVSSSSLGNLKSGDYTLASFQITSTSSQMGNMTDTTDTNTRGPRGDMTQLPDGFDGDFNTDGQMPTDFQQFMRNRTSMSSFGGDPLIVQITYTDLFGVRQTVEKEVKLTSSVSSSSSVGSFASDFNQMSNQQGDIDSGTMYILVGVLGIIIIVVVLKFGTIKKKIQGVKTAVQKRK